jgi:tetratricopeptide (TPR) repeat protein
MAKLTKVLYFNFTVNLLIHLTLKRRLKMKTVKCASIILWILFFVLPVNLFAQGKEIPITTSSKEALKYFIEGRDKIEDIEFITAASNFDKAISKDPGFAMAYLYRSMSGSGGAKVAQENMDKAVNLAGKVSEGEKLVILSYQAGNDGNAEKQKEYLEQLVKLFPSDKRAQLFAGTYYYNNYNYSKALTYLEKATALDKDYAIAYNLIGYCQSALTNYAQAEKAFQMYIKLKPTKANPYDSYGELLLTMGKYDESIAQYKKAVEIDPVNFGGSLLGIGHNYIFKGNYNDARKYYQEYFDKAPSASGKLASLYWKATSYIHEGDIDNALKTFAERSTLAEKEDFLSPAIFSCAFQGQILTETGKPAEGMEYYNKAYAMLEKAKLPDVTKKNIATYSVMWNIYGYSAMGEFDKAKAEIEKGRQKLEGSKNPGEMMMFSSMQAYYELKKGDYEKAMEYISKADPEDPMNMYYTAVAYTKKGDKQNALKLFEKITKSNVNSLNLALVRKRAIAELKK